MNPEPSPVRTVPADAALILDAAAIERALKRIAHEIIERNPDLSRVALIGIPSRGVEIARRLGTFIAQFGGITPFVGVVDVAMHRDDLHRRRIPPRVARTELPLDLEGKTLVLTDDVLFSGRTCRAAMETISSFGRPARIQYAALIDRGHRELPIRADYVGKNIPTAPGQRVFVRFSAIDNVEDAVWLDRAPTNSPS